MGGSLLLSINALSPLHSCPSLPHWSCHHVFSISLALSLSHRLSCCAVMQWIELLAWLQILPPNRHKSSPEREASRTMCCIIKRAVLPEGIMERSKGAGERTDRENPENTPTQKERYGILNCRLSWLKNSIRIQVKKGTNALVTYWLHRKTKTISNSI